MTGANLIPSRRDAVARAAGSASALGSEDPPRGRDFDLHAPGRLAGLRRGSSRVTPMRGWLSRAWTHARKGRKGFGRPWSATSESKGFLRCLAAWPAAGDIGRPTS